jgi:hypothetical protein
MINKAFRLIFLLDELYFTYIPAETFSTRAKRESLVSQSSFLAKSKMAKNAKRLGHSKNSEARTRSVSSERNNITEYFTR